MDGWLGLDLSKNTTPPRAPSGANKVKAPLQLAILCQVSKSDQLSDGGRNEDEEEEKEDIQKIEGEEELCDEEGEGSLWW